jgi:uncharacterized protein with von Willebrand factor type A (vWA) domain
MIRESVRLEERELLVSLTELRRPSLPVNSWPGDAVYYEYLRWLDNHPEIQEWCSGNADHARRVIRLLHLVVRCVERKLNGQTSELLKNGSAAEEPEINNDIEQRTVKDRGGFWGFWRRRQMPSKQEERRRMSQERVFARACFKTCSTRIVDAAADCGLLRELVEELGFSSVGWDLSTGKLEKSVVQRLRAALAKLKDDPDIHKVLEDLGRLEKTIHTGSSSKFSEFVEWVTQSTRVLTELIVPGVVMDVTGVELSDELELMLSDEVAFLAHPKLRGVWFQRFAEGQLATWKVQGTDIEHQDVRREALKRNPVPVRSGPIIVLLDTSGSMSVGQREPMAKAVVLLLCQIAQKRDRRIFVVSFSGPGQTLDFEFTPDAAGLSGLADFLEWKFDGGTDVDEPLQRSLRKCQNESAWNSADVAIISDGYFDFSPETVQLVKDCRDCKGLEVSALLIDGSSGASRKICKEARIHELSTWRSLAR